MASPDTSPPSAEVSRSARVVVASSAAMKIGALRRAVDDGCFGGAGALVEGVKAPSGINEQPWGHEETISGAMNRLAAAKEMAPGADFYVAIENGIFEVATSPEPRCFDLAWVVVEAGTDGRQAMAHSVGVEFPRTFVQQAREEGFDKTHAGHKLAAANGGVDVQDPHRWLSSDRLCREDLLAGALSAAWG
eukprot:CAMPEP_0177226390 /NCGR_PEP_ID=MMETSP0367-20130122/40057_1 /TAXON_ID=447022 ORGANISM="Scrippsiella hangoei-like, Strain SHHI-4" /NCGR_SAMPLE_ID=MMETSP0367 /ASSEMBLY_ACC=CAM_ASM_000362 /LENGTH=190 /DNA_ID=CAMNT_0018676553 /DNA_START=18 /DNA_END=586 /DNA_ORIENTATION=-